MGPGGQLTKHVTFGSKATSYQFVTDSNKIRHYNWSDQWPIEGQCTGWNFHYDTLSATSLSSRCSISPPTHHSAHHRTILLLSSRNELSIGDAPQIVWTLEWEISQFRCCDSRDLIRTRNIGRGTGTNRSRVWDHAYIRVLCAMYRRSWR